MAAEEDEAQPSGRDFDDTASEASSAVSGMSAYGGSTATGASSVTGSSGRPASTVGGKKPYKRKQRKVGRAPSDCAAILLLSLSKPTCILQSLQLARLASLSNASNKKVMCMLCCCLSTVGGKQEGLQPAPSKTISTSCA